MDSTHALKMSSPNLEWTYSSSSSHVNAFAAFNPSTPKIQNFEQGGQVYGPQEP